MKQTHGYRDYLSPKHKLLRIFENSRDQWREKCKTAKAALKYSKHKAKRLEQQRDRWRIRAEELSAKVAELESRTCPPGTYDR